MLRSGNYITLLTIVYTSYIYGTSTCEVAVLQLSHSRPRWQPLIRRKCWLSCKSVRRRRSSTGEPLSWRHHVHYGLWFQLWTR
jgi:hypothetical protein